MVVMPAPEYRCDYHYQPHATAAHHRPHRVAVQHNTATTCDPQWSVVAYLEGDSTIDVLHQAAAAINHHQLQEINDAHRTRTPATT